jgi:adenosyl cobinamide kinase/adenosyl cobinamide phosphate guanylyltransferase
MRDWREMVGRTLTYLGKEAKEVTRVFCGLPQQLK